MKYCLDTNIIVKLFRGDTKITLRIKEIEEKEEICITIINVYELYKGVYSTRKKERHFQNLKDFLKETKVLNINEDVCDKAGSIYATLKKENQLIEDADLLIGSIVLNNDAELVTTNPEHFKRVPTLKIENWLR